MNRLSIAKASLLAAAIGVLAPSAAEAGSRLHFNYFAYEPGYQTYYPGPVYVPRPRYFYYHDYEPDPYYAYEYEPEYYEPEYQPRRYKRPARPYVSRKQRQERQEEAVVPQQKAATGAYEEPDINEAEAAPEPVKKKSAAISCDKAAKIVADYGFKSVKASSCKGQVYSFKGSRDGKSYTIKLSSKSGELTEVKKL